VDCVSLAPLAMLFELYLALNFALVLATPIIDTLAFGALEFDEIVLTHINKFKM